MAIKVLVTGGCGFIGSHLVEALLQRSCDVTVIDNLSTGRRENLAPGAKLIVDDIRNPDVVNQAMQNADCCFHLAAVASVTHYDIDYDSAHETNLTGSLHVFSAAHHGKITPVIYASSAAVYGDIDTACITESDRCQPISEYGNDKLKAEIAAKAVSHDYGVPTTGFRFFNVYGPRQDPSSAYCGVITNFMNKIKADKPITIYGDGSQTRDFVFVGDVVNYLLAAMDYQQPKARFYNVCTGRQTQIIDLAKCLCEIAGKEPNIVYCEKRSDDIQHSLGNPSRAAQELGIVASTELATGLARLFASVQ